MKKLKLKKNILIITLATFISFYANKSFAFLYPMGPVFDPINVAGEAVNTVATAANNVLNIYYTAVDQANVLKRALADTLSGVLGGKKQPGKLPGARIIGTSSIDYHNENEVKNAIYEYFWEYPANIPLYDDPDAVERAYKSKSLELYQDNLIEVWSATRGLETAFLSIKEKHKTLTDEMLKETDGSGQQDDNDQQDGNQEGEEGEDTGENLGHNELWQKAYEAYKTYDALYALIEEMTAMKAQLLMSRAIGEDVEPIYKENTQGQSSQLIFKINQAYASENQNEDPSYKDEKPEIKFGGVPINLRGTFVPFESTRAEVNELKKFEEVVKELKLALDYHNTMQSLPANKNVFIKYEQMKKLHQKAIEMEKISDKCVIDYLSRYYNNANKIWTGLSSSVEEVDLTQGLRGVAYNRFIIQKAIMNGEAEEELINSESQDISPEQRASETSEQTEERLEGASAKDAKQSPVVNQELAAETSGQSVVQTTDAATKYGEYANIAIKAPEADEDMGEFVTTPDPKKEFDADEQKQVTKETQKNFEDSPNSGFSSDSEKQEAIEDTRTQGKLYWDVGNQHILDLLYNPSEYGASIKKEQLLWEDNKIFYKQYLHKKYDNIRDALIEYTTTDLITKIITPALNADSGTTAQRLSRIDTFKIDSKGAIIEVIEKYKEKISKLETKDFDADNHDFFIKMHKDMINELKSVVIKINNLRATKVLLALNLFDMFKNAYTLTTADYETEDDKYFVGKEASKKDFKAPAKPQEGNLPDPRELIYFDDVDWVNTGGRTNSPTPQKFNDYGGYIPKIWELMLGINGPAFEETEFDLSVLAEHEAASRKNLARGGRYPCKMGDLLVDYDGKDTKRYTVYKFWPQETKEDFHDCIKEKSYTFENALDAGLIRKENSEPIGFANLVSEPFVPQPTSALATFLKNSSSFATLTNYIYKQIDKEKNSKSNTDTDDDDEQTSFQRDMSEKMIFKTNQIGDFLRAVEDEKELKKSVEEINAKLDIIKYGEILSDGTDTEGLYDKLETIGTQKNATDIYGSDVPEDYEPEGYELSQEFSLANPDDYKKAFDLLNHGKNYHKQNAFNALESLEAEGELIEERRKFHEAVIHALEDDEDAYIVLGTTAPEDLEEQIKEKKAEAKADAEYQKEADKAMEDALNNFTIPYCAAY